MLARIVILFRCSCESVIPFRCSCEIVILSEAKDLSSPANFRGSQ